jgi:hypothetical protein
MDLPACTFRITKEVMDSMRLREATFQNVWMGYESNISNAHLLGKNNIDYIRQYIASWFAEMCRHKLHLDADNPHFSEYILTCRFPDFTINATLTIV